MGLFKARFRDAKQSAAIVHKDDIRITEHDVRLALFPLVPVNAATRDYVFQRYHRLCDEMNSAHPTLNLPRSATSLQKHSVDEVRLEVLHFEDQIRFVSVSN